ncbi:MAG: 2'-5' RNA ligase family protein [Candidatus Riflebacteria bacterium]|nr:2'-5' RNA ligase family protein [Candidatus Riflebacteria bacterium]
MVPHKQLPFTVAFLLPEEALNLISIYKKRLEGICYKFETNDTLHLTIKYLGYPSQEFPEKLAIDLIPKIRELLWPYIPAKVAIRGIDMFWKSPEADPVAYFKVVSEDLLKTMHEILLDKLGKFLEPFPNTDGINYKPHVTISKFVVKSKVPRLKKLVYRSRKNKKRLLLLKDLVLFTPNSTHTIISK